jgi:hypothetical protein
MLITPGVGEDIRRGWPQWPPFILDARIKESINGRGSPAVD